MLDPSTIEKILQNPEYTTCTCSAPDCEYHGKCKECVALHRYAKMLPACLTPAEDQQ